MSSSYNIEYRKYKKYKKNYKNYKNFNYGGSGRTKIQFDDNISRKTIELLQKTGYFIYDINITRQFPPQKVSQMESIISTLNNISTFNRSKSLLAVRPVPILIHQANTGRETGIFCNSLYFPFQVFRYKF